MKRLARPKAHARAGGDELFGGVEEDHAFVLERVLNGQGGDLPWRARSTFEIHDGPEGHPRGFGRPLTGPIQEGASGTALSGSNHETTLVALFMLTPFARCCTNYAYSSAAAQRGAVNVATKKLKPFAIKGDNMASRLAARAEDLLKANRDIEGETFDRLRDLENEASHHQARSREAALFQLGVLANTGERLAEDLPAHEVDRLLAMNVRLVRSLVSYVETITGVNRHECGFAFYFGPGEK